jgi:hypothetical protein
MGRPFTAIGVEEGSNMNFDEFRARQQEKTSDGFC